MALMPSLRIGGRNIIAIATLTIHHFSFKTHLHKHRIRHDLE
jgi:hypothetical protein